MSVNDIEFARMISAARKRNEERDNEDSSRGLALPGDIGSAGLVAVARDAIECAIRQSNWECAAEAYVFLLDALSIMGKTRRRLHG